MACPRLMAARGGGKGVPKTAQGGTGGTHVEHEKVGRPFSPLRLGLFSKRIIILNAPQTHHKIVGPMLMGGACVTVLTLIIASQLLLLFFF